MKRLAFPAGLLLAMGALLVAAAPVTTTPAQQAACMKRHPSTLKCLGLAAATAEADGRIEAAEKVEGPNGETVLLTTSVFASELVGEGRYQEALPYLRRQIGIHRALRGDAFETAQALTDLGRVLMTVDPDGAVPEADEALTEALRIRRGLPAADEGVALSLANLGELRGRPASTEGRAERIDAAAELFREAIDILERRCSPPSCGTLQIYADWGSMLAANQRPAEAVILVERASKDSMQSTGYVAAMIAGTLRERGFSAEASALDRRYGEAD